MKVKNELNKLEVLSSVYTGAVTEALNSAMTEHCFDPQVAQAFKGSFMFYFNRYLKAVSNSLAKLNKEAHDKR